MKCRLTATTAIFVTSGLFSQIFAAESAADLLPPSTIFYAEISNPSVSIDNFRDNKSFRLLKNSEPYQQLTQNPKFLQGMVGLRFAEVQLGMTWHQAVRTLSAGGISIGFDAESQGLAILMKAESEQNLTELRDKVITLARQDAKNKGNPDPYEATEYRGITAYKTKDGGFFTYQDWLFVGNKGELARGVIDAILDGRDVSLARTDGYRHARSLVSEDAVAWAVVNLDPLRQAEDKSLEKLFSGRADDPGGELLLGGVLETLKSTPVVVGSLTPKHDGMELSILLPRLGGRDGDLRSHYFGPDGKGAAADIPDVPNQLAAISVYRNVSEMWLRAGDLFDEKTNDGLAQADGSLSMFFAGKDFGEDILGAFEPTLQIIAARQSYPEDRPVPAIKLPAFALVAEMKAPETTTRELTRVFHSFVGFFNIVGTMNGNRPFELDFQSHGDARLITAVPVPDLGKETEQDAMLTYNFSPTIAFAGKRMILSSATHLARALLNSEQSTRVGDGDGVVNTHVALSVSELQKLLTDNRTHLISQNILKKGQSEQEASLEIGLLLNLLKLFDHAQLQLSSTDEALKLTVEFQLAIDNPESSR